MSAALLLAVYGAGLLLGLYLGIVRHVWAPWPWWAFGIAAVAIAVLELRRRHDL